MEGSMEKKKKTTIQFNWNSKKTKLIAGMMAFALIPAISIAAISGQVSKNVMYDEITSSTLEVTKQASAGLDYKMDGVVAQLQLLASNAYFTDFYSNADNSTKSFYLLENALKTNLEYENVYFASTNKQMILAPKQELPDGYDPTNREWFTGAVEQNGEVYYSKPYHDAITNKFVLTISRAVKDKYGEIVGVAAIDLNLKAFSNSINKIVIGDHGYMTIIGKDGQFITHPDEKQIGSDMVTKLSLWDDLKKQEEGISHYELNGADKFSAYTTNPKTGWKFVSALEQSEIEESGKKINQIGWLFTAIFAVFSGLFAYSFGGRIGKQILMMKEALERAAKGDFTARVSINAKDEFKILEQSFNDMMDQLSVSLRKVGETSKSVLDTSAHLSAMTQETNAALSEVALAIEEIAQGAGLQAKNIQVGYDSMKDLSQQLDDISVVTGNMNQVSQQTMELSNKGLAQVGVLTGKASETKSSTNEVASIIKEVEVRMEEINTIIDAITKITDQTNLLSLNASIESARAGEHGRGFAVVANEVRKLAEQSKASADEIKHIVDSIKNVVKKAVVAMERTNQAVAEQDLAMSETKGIFHEILEAIRELASKVEGVEQSVKESQSNKDTINQEMDSITAVSEQTAAATEQVSASAEEISVTMNSFTQHAGGLKDLAEQLDQELKKFKW
jgi:methyl-accepting chemotaxis protein